MNLTDSLAAETSKFSFLLERARAFFLRYPEWWAWALSLCVWMLLASVPYASHKIKASGFTIYCSPKGTVQAPGHSTYEVQGILKEDVFSEIATTLSNGSVHWMIMIIAMMFPLLNKPIRHVAFSVRRRDRSFGILWFLVGYAITWAMAGLLFLLLPLFLDMLIGEQIPFVSGLIKASGFLLAAVLIWQPARPLKMIRCDQTMPIRIQGWGLHMDSLSYGWKMGVICLGMCWAPMAALVLAHHSAMLMYLVTVVLIYERYLLPHTSKLPGYAWIIMAFIMFGAELLVWTF